MKITLKETFFKKYGFFLIAILLFWLKTYLAYHLDFSLGVDGAFQQLILFLNPLASTIFIFGLSLFFSDSKKSNRALLLLYFLNSLLLFSNILYYREFSDFITIKSILSSASITKSIGPSIFQMFKLTDIVYWIDFILMIHLYRKKKTSQISYSLKKKMAFTTMIVSILVFLFNLNLAEISRPQLLTRTFDRNYIVKYLGLNVYTIYDGVQTAKANSVRASADSSDMATVLDYLEDHHAEPNEAYFGKAEGRNIVYVHLESMQQFIINLSMIEKDGTQSEVTPFLNSLYDNEDSISFSNFFHQTGQGKTSDAELLMDNSLFGLPQGSAFTQAGSDNTFHAAPQILKNKGYTSAVFHGNVGSFWNRDNTYKAMGYDYFFSAETSYTLNDENSLEYGLKDKLFLQESVQYLEQMEQPFYTKFLTVSNHFPFPEDELNTVYEIPETPDSTVTGYFNTAHYADQAVEEFFQYMKDSGLYEDTIFILYGDHFGISNSRNTTLAPLLGKSSRTWGEYDNAMLQRVPMIIHIPGLGNGSIQDTYGGQVDALPTLMHLLGIQTETYVQLGQDLLSEERNQIVPFRNGITITPEYTIIGNSIYDTKTGNSALMSSEDSVTDYQNEVNRIKEASQKQLMISDQIINGDLLRFYSPADFIPADRDAHNYLDSPAQLLEDRKEAGDEGTSLIQQNNGKSSVPLYKTDAPEFPANQTETELDSENTSSEKEVLETNLLE
ncbi:LTA synthase family protein [Jeotgalibaca sp. MA1X17-3]|uniref:LTA synthase family protein n=1 Tax=Jeotgalibaca sp. MA1X17-3 TaxID=2908211 RepID=UPI001F41E902|nr:LTA synthase family protein [Jeotgalibaca sp. MA1X17-3]UJF15468.1 LTA synthase family protein [Jeotgalibaca sp. MA1X17-3]